MKIGFIGVGNMGRPMCDRLLEAGHQLVVHDARDAAVRPLGERQARIVGSARAVADEAELVCASLPTLAAYREVALGKEGVRGSKAARIFVNLGTVGTRFIEDLTRDLAAASITTIDCPISGGPPGAAEGSLSIMASGPKDAFATLEPALKALGKVTYVGEKPGMAQSLKLANNILSATALVATSEAIVMGVKAGLDPEIMLQAINLGSGRNSSTLQKFPEHVLTGAFDYGAAVDILLKDVDLALAEGEAMGVPMPVCQSVRQAIRLAKAVGGGTQDITRIAALVAGWAGTTIPKTR
jgi:3-hydroxyisobutyrate dehydrogenase-like beta-hydroxyacid dehydrogenase